MNVSVNFFGPLVDITGVGELAINDVVDTSSLRERVLRQFPELQQYALIIAVNKQIVNANQALRNGDAVAILPPFSGG